MALLCGKYDGSAMALTVQPSDLLPLFDLPLNGHIASIRFATFILFLKHFSKSTYYLWTFFRCANYSLNDQVLLTGGEDSFACKWVSQSQRDIAIKSIFKSTTSSSNDRKSTSKAPKVLRRNMPY